MRILAFTTSTPSFSAALVDAGEVLAEARYEHVAHAERMFEAIDRLFADHPKRSLDAVAVDVGPGSFTGIRVGLAAGKGLAMGLGLPLLPVGSLHAMAHEALRAHPPARRAVSVLDAKRRELFVAAFDRDGAVEPARHLPRDDEASLASFAGDDTVWCGEPVDVGGARWVAPASPSAIAIAHLAAELAPPSLEDVEPVYLRPPDAKKPQGLPKLARG